MEQNFYRQGKGREGLRKLQERTHESSLHRMNRPFFKAKKKVIDDSMRKFSFYSENDIKFRLTRDFFLTNIIYKKIMKKLFEQKSFNINKVKKHIFLQKKDIIKLHKLGHEIGLHSHSHPTQLAKLNYKKQFEEYNKNSLILKKILQIKKIKSMSHPCGSYNSDTLKILKKMKVEIGFRQIMLNKKANLTHLEICRQDHSNIMRLMDSTQ